MQLNITARHLELTPALTDYVHRKVEKAQRYFDSIIWAQAILCVEKHRHIAELVVHTPGSTFRTQGEAGDLYAAVDLAVHKLDVHLSRVKDRTKNRHREKEYALTAPGDASAGSLEAAFVSEPSSPISPQVIEVKQILLKPLPVSQAIKQLNSNGLPVLLFINGRTNRISVLYRKGKKGFGILEAEEP